MALELFELIAEGAGILFTPYTLLILVVSLLLGTFAGALPGLSSSNTSAIMLPLTIGMPLEGALVFIIGIYVGAQFGGAIPAILINVPGTTGAGATTLDGYQLSLQGKADYALGLSTGASAFGGVFAGIFTLLIFGPIAKVALKFRSPEVFLMAVVGITIIASLSGSGKQLRKGLLAGFVGFLIGAMAADPVRGRARLDFGFYELYDAFPMIPPLVGLFAFPSLFDLVGTQQVAPEGSDKVGRWGNVMRGVWATFKYPFILLWTSFIGLVIGILPAAGIDTASFLAYGQAKAWCEKPELFGKGHPAGVIAPEAANNGVTAGALVPTLTLGIPGSATTAIMLAALLLHGINPGPYVVRDYRGIVYAVLLAALVGSFLCFFIGMVFNRFSAKVTIIPTRYLIPATILLCVISAVAVRYFLFDIYLMVLFGLLGFIMTKTDYPYMPMILGIVMGPMAEENFLRSLTISLGDFRTFIASPIAKVLWLVIIASIVSTFFQPVLRRWKEKKQKA